MTCFLKELSLTSTLFKNFFHLEVLTLFNNNDFKKTENKA